MLCAVHSASLYSLFLDVFLQPFLHPDVALATPAVDPDVSTHQGVGHHGFKILMTASVGTVSETEEPIQWTDGGFTTSPYLSPGGDSI